MAGILIADDNAASRDLMRAILKGTAERIFEANDGREALAIISRERPDLVLLDVDMPVLDGYAVVRRLRADARFFSLPVVAVTACAMQGDRERALAAGFTGYIAKPVRAAGLRQEVAKLLGRHTISDARGKA